MSKIMAVLDFFHPLIRKWFVDSYTDPTDVQRQAWPRIIAGEHVLISAPTGSGKTLTAFLWAINQLAAGTWASGRTHVLYISPLKALNTDIQRNLILPLNELKEVFAEAGQPFPEVRVLTRSGDTPATDRRRMLRYPPEILITTPESLNLLLSSQGGRSLLRNLSTVILDEIHTVVNNKRGVHLITAVDRLIPLSGEFQRIAISATVKPMEAVAEFVGGFRLEGDALDPRYLPRTMSLVESRSEKDYALRICFPEETSELQHTESFWKPLVREFRDIIRKNRATLFFAKSRRLSESITLKINAEEKQPLAYAHHGSLAKELRLEVENKLKAGDLKAIVATNSLELGIDIGALDEVVLVQSPPAISSAVQRVGRAGHKVGETSRGTFYPTHDLDYLESAVIARAILDGDIEDVKPVAGALDVLAQILISMTGIATWDIDELYAHLRTSWPYHNLSREHFILVLNMLAGRYADTRIRELKPRISIDRMDNSVAARKGALLQLYTSGGTIPDRGYYHLRHEETGSLIGELDEEFVWEATLGQTFTFGTQHWKISRITHNDVLAVPASPHTKETPFWTGEVFNRDFFLSEKIADFLEEAETGLDDPEWEHSLQQDFCMEAQAAGHLLDFLKRQKKETLASLPHRRHILVEQIASGPGGSPGNQVVLHTFWGGRVNRPFAMALDAAWEEHFGHRLEIFAGDDCIVLQLPPEAAAHDFFSLVSVNNLEDYLRQRLESSGFFGARFRECAGRALLLPKRKMNERMPLWMSRLRSQKLKQSVMKLTDFPILLETWRTCLQDEFDLEALKQVLTEISSGSIQITDCKTSHPSPMAQGMTWAQIETYMYARDSLPGDKVSHLRGDLLREVVFSPGLRPQIPPEITQKFEEKRQRLSPGYAPSSERELVDWIKERVLVPWPEWEELRAAIRRDHSSEEELSVEETITNACHKLVKIKPETAESPLVAAWERLPAIRELFSPEPPLEILPFGTDSDPLWHPGSDASLSPDERDSLCTSLLGEWLSFYGPYEPKEIGLKLGISSASLHLGLEDLRDADMLITGMLVKDSEADMVCDAENFEILLRMSRAAAVPQVKPREICDLQLFLAVIQGQALSENTEDAVFRALDQLVGYNLPAELWEGEILPARIPDYTLTWLDSVLRQSGLRWQGNREKKVRFFYEDDVALLAPDPGSGQPRSPGAEKQDGESEPAHQDLFPDSLARYDYLTLLERSGNDARKLEGQLWNLVWEGQLSNDTFSSLRRGLQNDFRVWEVIQKQRESLQRGHRAGSRLHLSRWKETQAYPGNWFLLSEPGQEDDPDLIEQEERRKDRVRLLLDRYGVLFRELLHREPAPFRWRDLFRTLRLMELSGEVLAGYFFKGIPGAQFISHRAFRIFQTQLPQEAIYWLNAVDPVSQCGIPLDALRGSLPKRVEGTHLVYHGSKPVMYSQRKGQTLTFLVPPADEHLPEYLVGLRHLLNREFSPIRRIIVESINDEPAIQSPYLPLLKQSFDVVVDIKQISLYRKVGHKSVGKE
jgi:ATP-dependent Lhr-like helicase